MNHSDKAKETFKQMNTVASNWGLTEIKWKLEEKMVPFKVKCPDCFGGECYVDPKGKPFNFYKRLNIKYYSGYDKQNAIKKYKLEKKRCPTCPPRRGWRSNYGTGEVWDFKKMKVWVGYPQWHKKTQFDSRFEGKIYERDITASGKKIKCVCELCSKSITAVFPRMVPVTGKSKDDIIHGMWVGEDCAKKFFGIKNYKKDKNAVIMK